MIEKIFMEYLNQCIVYARSHYDPRRSGRDDITYEDIASEMAKLIWQSCKNGNGITNVIEKKKLIPTWQLRKFFLNALRNLKIIFDEENEDMSYTHPLKTAKVVLDEDGGIVDYYYPSTPNPLEEKEEEQEQEKKSKVPTGRERELWLQRIRRLKEQGFSDEEILKMLKPIKQEVLF